MIKKYTLEWSEGLDNSMDFSMRQSEHGQWVPADVAEELASLLCEVVGNEDAVAIYPSAIEQNDSGSVDFEEWAGRVGKALSRARGE